MANYTEYFERIGYKSKFDLGDRVFGKWNNIPFVGSVGSDTLINEEQGPRITVHVDLPIKFNDKYHYVIIVKHKDIKPYK
jgi:hypothetical protein